MTGENLIHIKLEYEEALQSKKDILSSQMAMLKIERTIRGYHSYRSQGFELKINLSKKIRELKSNIWNLQKILPRLKIPEILRKEERVKKEHKSPERKKPQEGNLEEQLQDIQRRLNELQNR
jgi:hypothetical protein